MTIKKSKGEIRNIRVTFVVNRLEALYLEQVKKDMRLESTGAAMRKLFIDKYEESHREDER